MKEVKHELGKHELDKKQKTEKKQTINNKNSVHDKTYKMWARIQKQQELVFGRKEMGWTTDKLTEHDCGRSVFIEWLQPIGCTWEYHGLSKWVSVCVCVAGNRSRPEEVWPDQFVRPKVGNQAQNKNKDIDDDKTILTKQNTEVKHEQNI